jgi:hypothetical protein
MNSIDAIYPFWKEELGILLSEQEMGLKLPNSDLAKLRTKHKVIALLTGGGQWFYPLFQFSDSGKVNEKLVRSFWKLARDVDTWTAAATVSPLNQN